MMKKLLCFMMLIITISEFSMAQVDSALMVNKLSKFDTELTLSSRNISRGVSWGKSPSIQMMGKYMPCSHFEIGTYGQATLNGISEGYGNQLNLYATFKYSRLSLTIDDFFYFNSNAKDNNYLDYSSEKTQHFIESRLKYDGNKFDLTAAYTVYQNEGLSSGDAFYLEAGYDVTDHLNMFVGYVTDKSDQIAYSEAGFTSVGATISKRLNVRDISPLLKTSLVFVPNYKNVYNVEGVEGNPVYLVVSLTF